MGLGVDLLVGIAMQSEIDDAGVDALVEEIGFFPGEGHKLTGVVGVSEGDDADGEGFVDGREGGDDLALGSGVAGCRVIVQAEDDGDAFVLGCVLGAAGEEQGCEEEK